MADEETSESQSGEAAWPTTRLPLASLTADISTQAVVDGVATLLWPFSTSTSTFSILLCEEDFRLRRSRGQLRVNFHGQSAREVHSKMQIGDKVKLSLEGVQFKDLDSPAAEDVPWSAEFSRKLLIKVSGSSGDATIQVNDTSEDHLDETNDDGDSASSSSGSPEENSNVYLLASEKEWSTPGPVKRRLDAFSSSPFFMSGFFEEEEGLEEDYQPRKKVRISDSYKLEETPSPETNYEVYRDELLDSENPTTQGSAPVMGLTMFPPPLPPIVIDGQNNDQTDEMPDSPSLKPVPSPSLPLVPPFLHQGLSAGDYMSIDLDSQESLMDIPGLSPHFIEREIAKAIFDNMEQLTTRVASPQQIPVESAESQPESQLAVLSASKRGSAAASLVTSPVPATESDGDSEKDSLFDDGSDGEGMAQRQRSRSPLPGPSPLRKVQQAVGSPEVSPTNPSKLSIRTGFTPLNRRDSVDTPLKTPQLYLPTPSPKVSIEGTNFSFTAPPKLDIGFEPFGNDDVVHSERRSLFGNTRKSAPTDLSAYFGRPKRTEDQGDDKSHDHGNKEVIPTPGGSVEELSFSDSSLTEEEFRSGITTSLSDFPALAFLSWNQTVDVIGVVCQTTEAKRSEKGPKDHYVSMRIVDSSQTGGTIVRIFRPYKEALPKVETSDVIMLRSFIIKSQKHKLTAISTDNSAWAVWKDQGKGRPGVCAGPPVEYCNEEEGYVEALGGWYASLDETKRQEMETKNIKELGVGVE